MAGRLLLRALWRQYSTVKSDPYKALGLAFGANRQDVKKAFYRLAKIFHPDVDPTKSARFLEINRAYQELRRQAPVASIEAPKKKTESIVLDLTPAEATQGCRKKVVVEREVLCQRCVGLGCDWCMHRGVVAERCHVQLLVPTGTVHGAEARYSVGDGDKLQVTFRVQDYDGVHMDHGLRRRIFVRYRPPVQTAAAAAASSSSSWLGRVMRFVRGV